MRLLIMGPQGVGKGTQAALLSEHYGIPAISTGDIFRYNIKNKTELGVEALKYIDKGELVPDELTNKIVKDRLAMDDAKNGWILDGYPRNASQVEALDAILGELDTPLDAVVALDADHDVLMERIHSNYRKIISFNFLLICLGVAGVLPPATSALLHNASTLVISLKSMTKLLA